MENVLELMLLSYAFMVSGMLVPVVAALFTKNPNAKAALVAMIAGGSTTLTLIILQTKLPLGLDANIFGITVSALLYILMHQIFTKK
jgi:SSS family solute:Na+ symporter